MHPGFGLMRVEVVDDEDPFALPIGPQRLQEVVGEVLFGARRGQRRGQDTTGGDLEVGDQTLRAVADVVLLPALDISGNRRRGRMQALRCLPAGLLVAADQMHPVLVERPGLLIQGTDRGHVRAKGVRLLGRRIEPRPGPMRLEVRLLLKNDPPYGSICSPRCFVSPPLRPPLGPSRGSPGVARPAAAHRRGR